MKIIVGLGNHGKEYEGTRHNAGFFAIDALLKEKELCVENENELHFDKKFNAEICQVSTKGEKVIFVKPNTFMNLSGEAVNKILQFYKAGIGQLIVYHDDIDIPVGHAQIKLKGGSAGHNGIQNIIDTLGSDGFIRVRIGILPINGGEQVVEKVDGPIDTKDFVLSKFSDREKKIIDSAIDIANEYILNFIGSKEPIKATTLSTKMSD
ncbi:MAG: aminoacyl-tRNA hydrolase [Patescibacteria group bacterium]